jgi:hypothetical protein
VIGLIKLISLILKLLDS